MITIIDYGMGNPGSVRNMLSRIGVESVITSSCEDISFATKIIFPGVGAFDQAISNLTSMQIIPALEHKVLVEGVPILGICLGMQLFSKTSEEGNALGLGWLDAKTIRFSFPRECEELRIPHMGWNRLESRHGTPLFRDLPYDSRFYFVHSYHVHCHDERDVLATTTYGIRFHSAVARGNIWGTQFHPEKSHRFGLQILRNFVEITE